MVGTALKFGFKFSPQSGSQITYSPDEGVVWGVSGDLTSVEAPPP